MSNIKGNAKLLHINSKIRNTSRPEAIDYVLGEDVRKNSEAADEIRNLSPENGLKIERLTRLSNISQEEREACATPASQSINNGVYRNRAFREFHGKGITNLPPEEIAAINQAMDAEKSK